MKPTDPQLIASCLRGEQVAWNTLVDRYARLIYSIPRRYRLCESDCDDVFQAVCLALYRALDRIEDRSRLSAWLITSAHRESWRVGKKANRYPHLDGDIEDVSEPPEADAEQWERQHLVQQALTALGGQCEQLLRALFLERDHQDYQTIAERLGMKVGSIGPTRARCFKKFEGIVASLGLGRDDLTPES